MPTSNLEIEPYQGFEFEKFDKDLFGNSRADNNSIGAVSKIDVQAPDILDKSKYGPSWFSNEVEAKNPKTITIKSGDNLQSKIDEAENGDIVVFSSGDYEVNQSLVIKKKITLKSDENGAVNLNYLGEANTSLFQLHPKGFLNIENINLTGTGIQQVFASLKENMFTHFGLSVLGCEISNFDFALKVYKESFAERISFKNTKITNCENGLELSEETNDKGDYNTEYLTVDNCIFNNVNKNVIDYYRGGYDEATIGGNLLVTNSTFTNSGGKEENGILINTRGIINVDISDNIFKNNPVKLVALLWGAKNNSHSNNTIINSGKIVVEQNLKLKLMY